MFSFSFPTKKNAFLAIFKSCVLTLQIYNVTHEPKLLNQIVLALKQYLHVWKTNERVTCTSSQIARNMTLDSTAWKIHPLWNPGIRPWHHFISFEDSSSKSCNLGQNPLAKLNIFILFPNFWKVNCNNASHLKQKGWNSGINECKFPWEHLCQHSHSLRPENISMLRNMRLCQT